MEVIFKGPQLSHDAAEGEMSSSGMQCSSLPTMLFFFKPKPRNDIMKALCALFNTSQLINLLLWDTRIKVKQMTISPAVKHCSE